MGPGGRVVRRVEAGAGEPAVVLEARRQRAGAWPSAGRTWPRAWSWWTRGTRRWKARCRCPSDGGCGSCAPSAPRGRHVVVDGTGHDIPGNRPDVVASTILAVAAQVRAVSG